MTERTDMPEGEALEAYMARAYRVYQGNIRRTDPLIYRLTKGARQGMPEGELLEIALEALEKCRFEIDEA